MQNEKLIYFLQKLPLLFGLPFNKLMQLVRDLELQEFRKDQVVCQKGSVADYVYVVYSGEFEMLCKVTPKRHSGMSTETLKSFRQEMKN